MGITNTETVATSGALAAEREALQQERRDLEPACHAQSRRVRQILGVGGGIFLALGIALASTGEEAFGVLSTMVFVGTYFALQRATLHSPNQRVVMINVRIRKIQNLLYAQGALAEDKRHEVARRKSVGTLLKLSGFLLFLCTLLTIAFAGFVLFNPLIPEGSRLKPEEVLAFVLTGLAAAAFGTAWTFFVRARLRRSLGWNPTIPQTAKAMLAGVFLPPEKWPLQ